MEGATHFIEVYRCWDLDVVMVSTCMQIDYSPIYQDQGWRILSGYKTLFIWKIKPQTNPIYKNKNKDNG